MVLACRVRRPSRSARCRVRLRAGPPAAQASTTAAAAQPNARERLQEMIPRVISLRCWSPSPPSCGLPIIFATGRRAYPSFPRLLVRTEDSLYRMLRALTELGMFTEEPARTFGLNEAAEPLRSDVPGSLCERRQKCTASRGCVGRGAGCSTALALAKPRSIIITARARSTSLPRTPTRALLFDMWQAAGTEAGAKAVASAYDFSTAGSVMDVGGGFGGC